MNHTDFASLITHIHIITQVDLSSHTHTVREAVRKWVRGFTAALKCSNKCVSSYTNPKGVAPNLIWASWCESTYQQSWDWNGKGG